MISGNRDEAWPMYLAWPIPERFMLGVIRWHVTCMLSLAGHWQDRRALSNHVCAHSVIPMWHVVCLQHLARASSEQSRSTTVLPINHVIQIPQWLSGFVNHDYCGKRFMPKILNAWWQATYGQYCSLELPNHRIKLDTSHIYFPWQLLPENMTNIYRQVSNISCTFVGNKIVDHSDVVGASPVGAAPSTSSFSTQHMVLLDWAKTTTRRDEKHLSLGIWCVLY